MQRVLRKSSPASNNQIPQASLPSRAGALFSCRLSSFWQSAGLQNHRPLVRIHPHENSILLQTENRQRISTLTVFLWARADYASRAAKNSPLGCFCAVFGNSAAAVRIHPWICFEKFQTKEKLQHLYDAGVLGGAKQPKSEPLPSGASLAAISSKVMVFVPSL